ncbi:MAG: hypothetical protein NTX33_04740 [Propionibacteriales bacterium]|nr:hypothetical protein [Propionibacteriales bacterium]
MQNPATTVLSKVQEILANLPEPQRNSIDVLLIERLAVLIDTDPTVAAIKELRSAMREVAAPITTETSDALDEIRQRRQRNAATADSSRPDVLQKRGR